MNNNRAQKAAILSIGTEVTAGDIVNSNASFLASKLTDLGFNCDLHLAVPDQRALMTWALDQAIKDHGVVVITGGLGPTTDDFTREIIAEYCGQELVWNEDIWQSITRRLESVGAPIAQSNRRQAYFPAGAQIFTNYHGTASGFCVQLRAGVVVALPGPPREIEGLWVDSVYEFMRNLAPPYKAQKPLIWRCLGQSESKIGEIVEDALKDSGFTTGYRSHMPYIDVKVWIPSEQRTTFDRLWRPKLESAISNWLVGRDDDDLAKQCLDTLPRAIPIFLIDHATRGHITRRLFAHQFPSDCLLMLVTLDNPVTVLPAIENPHIKILIYSDVATGAWQLNIKGADFDEIYTGQSRYKGARNKERFCGYVGEKTLLQMRDFFSRENLVCRP